MTVINTQKFQRDLKSDKSLSRGARDCAEELFREQRGRIFRWVQMSRAKLAEALGCCKRTVSNYLAELRKAGYLDSQAQRQRISGEWVKFPSKHRFVPSEVRVLAKVQAVIRTAEHARKALAAIAARRADRLGSLGASFCTGGTRSVLKGKAIALLSPVWAQQDVALRDKYSDDEWSLLQALPNRL